MDNCSLNVLNENTFDTQYECISYITHVDPLSYVIASCAFRLLKKLDDRCARKPSSKVTDGGQLVTIETSMGFCPILVTTTL